MRIFKFDEEVSVPMTGGGANGRVAALTGDGARVRVDVLHLPPGGRTGLRTTAEPVLIAVVVGRGTVAGADDEQRDLSTGYAAGWDAGEPHAVMTAAGLTAVRIEGVFEVWALAVTTDIVVADYDPQWPEWFERVQARVWPVVHDLALRIDHVGSTSVPGLAAKPIIDMDIVVASEDDVAPAVERLATIGYRWLGDLGVVGRQAFRAPNHDPLPRHNLYVVVEDNKAHLDHWLFRDLLRADAVARERYAALKRRNVDVAKGDMDVYIAAKAALVTELLDRARAERAAARAARGDWPEGEPGSPSRPRG